MLGTITEQNGNGLLEDSHMPVGFFFRPTPYGFRQVVQHSHIPVGWPLHIDGAFIEPRACKN